MTAATATAIPGGTSKVIGKWLAGLLVCAALVISGLIYLRNRERVQVRVIAPTYDDIESTLSTTGTVTPVNDFPARANFSGLVESVYVHLGQKVHAGQMLVLMKDQYALSRLDAARAALDASEVSNENVQRNGSQEDRIGFAEDLVRAQNEQASASSALSTLQQLQQRGSVSEAEVAAATQRLQAANAALQALKDRTTHRYSPSDIASWKDRVAADKAALAAEKVSYANAHIASAIDGTVYLLSVAKYDFVPAGTDLLHVADLSKTHIRADFDELDIDKLHVGQAVNVAWEGQPGRIWAGHIVARPLAVTHSGGRNVGQCTIDVDDPKSELPVNTSVTVTVMLYRHAHVITLPRGAVRTEGPAHFAYRVVHGVLVKTPVDIGLVNALRAEVTRGINPGDIVAQYAVNGSALSDKLRVTTVE